MVAMEASSDCVLDELLKLQDSVAVEVELSIIRYCCKLRRLLLCTAALLE